MKAQDMTALLGRPLTSAETTNFSTYLKIAMETLEGLLCTSLCDQDDPKIYDLRQGYSTVFTDIFTDIDEIKIDGEVLATDKYSPRQWDRRSGNWFNSIVLNNRVDCAKEIEVSASWGFQGLPKDLQLLLARVFDHITKQNTLDRTVNSKKVEDFDISFNHSSITFSDTLWESLVRDNANVISRYSLCSIPFIRHGQVGYAYGL